MKEMLAKSFRVYYLNRIWVSPFLGSNHILDRIASVFYTQLNEIDLARQFLESLEHCKMVEAIGALLNTFFLKNRELVKSQKFEHAILKMVDVFTKIINSHLEEGSEPFKRTDLGKLWPDIQCVVVVSERRERIDRASEGLSYQNS